MQITLISFATLSVDIHKNVVFSNGKFFTFWWEKHKLNVILVSYDIKRESCIYDPVLLNLLNLLGENDNMLGKDSHLSFSSNLFKIQ